jgi:hypothetical protein
MEGQLAIYLTRTTINPDLNRQFAYRKKKKKKKLLEWKKPICCSL